jgi:hypothetical protein
MLPTAAGADQDLGALFEYRATIEAEGDGLCRLLLPEAVLRLCRPDLADLRVVDATGTELPFAVDGRPPGPTAEVRRLQPEIVYVDRERQRTAVNQYRWLEAYHLRLPPSVAGAPGWELVVSTSRPAVVTRLDARHRGSDGATRSVTEGASVFRLVTPRAERLRVALGALEAGVLEVQLTTEQGGFVEPTLHLESVNVPPRPRPATVGLETIDIVTTAGHTTLVVRRPRGLVPDQLLVTTTTSTFHRAVDVWDAGPGAREERLGTAELLRVASEPAVEHTTVRVAPPAGDQLQLVIADQDSPPLKDLEAAAIVHRPYLVTSLPSGTRAATLLLGGGRVRAPSYDVSGLLPLAGEVLRGNAAERARAIWDPARSNEASLSAIEPNPAWDPKPALAFALRPGRAVDRAGFTHARTLEMTPSSDGLARLRLEPEDLAVARTDLADLRIVDTASRQWAYLLERERSSTVLELDISWSSAGSRSSEATLTPPVAPVRVDRARLYTDLEFFDRPYTLVGTDHSGRELTLASGRLRRFLTPSQPVEVAFAPVRITELALRVNDGSDAPLPLLSATARAPLVDVYVPARPGTYTLLVGNPDAAPPAYELERIRSVVLAVPSEPITAGPLTVNSARGPIRKLVGAVPTGTLVVWGVLAAAVIALTWLTLRLARTEDADPS